MCRGCVGVGCAPLHPTWLPISRRHTSNPSMQSPRHRRTPGGHVIVAAAAVLQLALLALAIHQAQPADACGAVAALAAVQAALGALQASRGGGSRQRASHDACRGAACPGARVMTAGDGPGRACHGTPPRAGLRRWPSPAGPATFLFATPDHGASGASPARMRSWLHHRRACHCTSCTWTGRRRLQAGRGAARFRPGHGNGWMCGAMQAP